jgi:enoyl-CoA hydratase
MTECDDLIVHREGGASVIPLNRPKAINAMTLEMSIRIDAALDRFEHDPDVAAIVLEGAGERGLCAGDDIRGLYGSSGAGISSGAPSLPERRFSRKHRRRRDR